MGGAVRILIAHEQPVVREGLRRLLEGQEGFAVVGVAGLSAEGARLLADTHPDLILLGVESAAEPPLAQLRELQAAAPGVRVLLMGEAPVPLSDLLLAGARGVLRAEATPAELFKAVRTVMAGEYWVGREALDDVVQHLRRRAANGARDGSGLTARQRQVAAGVARGESNREIATRLGLSVATVKDHLTAVFNRLGLANRAELAAWATRRALEDEPPPESDETGSGR